MSSYTTIICDASGSGLVWAWACWLKTEDGPGLFSDGLFRPETGITMAREAELGAMANALRLALNNDLLRGRTMVSLQSDSIDAIRALCTTYPRLCRYVPHADNPTVLGKARKKLTPTALTLLTAIRDTAEVALVGLELRHVKAHTPRTDGRHAINRIVDRRARALFRSALKQGSL